MTRAVPPMVATVKKACDDLQAQFLARGDIDGAFKFLRQLLHARIDRAAEISVLFVNQHGSTIDRLADWQRAGWCDAAASRRYLIDYRSTLLDEHRGAIRRALRGEA